jgi:hypothetical protein
LRDRQDRVVAASTYESSTKLNDAAVHWDWMNWPAEMFNGDIHGVLLWDVMAWELPWPGFDT